MLKTKRNVFLALIVVAVVEVALFGAMYATQGQAFSAGDFVLALGGSLCLGILLMLSLANKYRSAGTESLPPSFSPSFIVSAACCACGSFVLAFSLGPHAGSTAVFFGLVGQVFFLVLAHRAAI